MRRAGGRRGASTTAKALKALRALTALTALTLTLAACSTGDEPGSAPTPAPTGATGPAVVTPTGPVVTPTATATFPADAVGDQLRWMVGQMNTGQVDSDVSSRFSPTFLQQVPTAQWLVMLGQLRVQAPWVVESVTTDGAIGAADLIAQGRRYRLTMNLDQAGRIDGALLKEAARGEAATDWAGVEARAQLAAPQTSILAADVAADGTLSVVHRSGEQGLRPIASMFKLYVLAAVAEKVRGGALTWDTPLTLTADDKTLPSGTLQNRPDGTRLSVREAATQMIRVSDNTAAQLLMRTVGEPAVRAAAARAGHTHPEAIIPFLTPRQMFWLGYDDSQQAADARSRWQESDEATRRRLLASVPMNGPGPESFDRGSTHWQAGIEWFATPQEVVAAHLYLDRLAGENGLAPLREMLTANGGIPVQGWSQQAFKGGSDAGVIAMSFLAPAPAGGGPRQALVMIGTSDRPVDEETFIAATGDAARLLAQTR